MFGCLCFPWLKLYSTTKLSPRSIPCVFLGYASSHKGYLCLNPTTGHTYTSRHVKFVEETFPFASPTHTPTTPKSPVNTSSPNSHLSFFPHILQPYHSTSSHEPLSTPQPVSQPTTTPPTSQIIPHSSSHNSTIQPTIPLAPSPVPSPSTPPFHYMITRHKSSNLKPRYIFNLSSVISYTPTSYTIAACQPQWRAAMSQEFNALLSQGTWELIPPSPTQNVLGSKWTYRTKYHSDGSIARHKACLVAQGFKQVPGLDFHETFNPVAKFPTIRILLQLATYHNWPIEQLDVSNAFLLSRLTETVYMAQPPGFVDSQHPNHVFLLKKAIYGLRQSPRQWYNTFSSALQALGFQFSQADPSLMLYNSNDTHSFSSM